MAIYAYYRVSTQTQAERNSTEMQRSVVERYCKDNGLTIDEVFEDNGVSGAMDDLDDSFMRDGIIALLGTLNEGDRVIVQNTSRLWRSDTAKVLIRREIKRAKAAIISVEQPTYDIYYQDPNEFLINSIMEVLDQYEKMTIVLKLSKGRKARANNGHKPCGTAPYGYKWDGNDIAIDYNIHLVVKDIFERYIEFKSLTKVKDYCDEVGYRTSTGKSFSKQALKNIIENDFYIGIVTYNGKKVSGYHPVFIDEDIFKSANEVLRR